MVNFKAIFAWTRSSRWFSLYHHLRDQKSCELLAPVCKCKCKWRRGGRASRRGRSLSLLTDASPPPPHPQPPLLRTTLFLHNDDLLFVSNWKCLVHMILREHECQPSADPRRRPQQWRHENPKHSLCDINEKKNIFEAVDVSDPVSTVECNNRWLRGVGGG